MYYKSLISLFFFLFTPLVLALNSTVPIEKSRSPLQISIEAITTYEKGQAVDFVVKFSSTVDLKGIQIKVLPTPAVIIHRGELNWHGDLNRDEINSLQFNATVPLKVGTFIQVLAEVKSANSQQFAAIALYKPPGIDVNNAFSASLVEKNSVMRSGRKIIEFPLR